MSIAASSNSSTPSGILRKTPRGRGKTTDRGGFLSKVRNDNAQLGSPTSSMGVHFAPPDNLSEILSIASSKKEDIPNQRINEEIQGLLTHLRNASGDVLVDWLQQIQKNVSVLKPKMENFVMSILRIAWADQVENVSIAYKDFLVNLVTAHGYYTKPVMKMLVSNLSGIANRAKFSADNEKESLDCIESKVFTNTHTAIRAILKVIPLAGRNSLLQYVRECQPYALTLDTHSHTNYIKNILAIADYAIQDEGARTVILGILTERLVQLDAQVNMNDNDSEDDTDKHREEVNNAKSTKRLSLQNSSPVAKSNLDAAMCVLFPYISNNIDQSGDCPISSYLYQDFLICFESYVLPTNGTGHVQFLVFFLVCMKSGDADAFLKWLWGKFISPNTPSILRQNSMAYIASFISRSLCVNKATLIGWLQKICRWIHAYIDQTRNSNSNMKIHSHGPFYSACQAVFYMFVFRQDEFKDSKVALDKLSKIRLQKIVTCHLNPLRFCRPAIVRNFSSVAQYLQLAYCETIIQKNMRLNLPVVNNSALNATCSVTGPNAVLHSFFPFDPYTLKDSKQFVSPHYRQYVGNVVTEEVESSSDEVLTDEDLESDDGEPSSSASNFKDICAAANEFPNIVPQQSKRQRLSSASKSISKNLSEFGYSAFPGFKQ